MATAALHSSSDRARIMASHWSYQPPSSYRAIRTASGRPSSLIPTMGPWCVFQCRNARASSPESVRTRRVSVQVVAVRQPSSYR